MDDGGFQIAHFWGIVSALAKVWILINGAWNQTGDFGNFLRICAEDEWEAGSKGCR